MFSGNAFASSIAISRLCSPRALRPKNFDAWPTSSASMSITG